VIDDPAVEPPADPPVEPPADPADPDPAVAPAPAPTPVAIAVVALLAAAFATTSAIRLGWHPLLVPFLLAAGSTAALAVIDQRTHRLPNRLVLPSIAAVGPLVVAASLVAGEPDRALGAVLGGAGLFALYLALALASRGQLGMGDVKLAALLGLLLGALPWPAWPLGLLAGFVLGALAAVVGLALRRTTLRSPIAFGPSMIVGAWLAVLLVGA
jgi:leader peptidase (prepilin peptidase)/N-methyltransferase